MNHPCIAIDGPAGAGKSTIARELARRFRFIYVDTGALYRAVGHFVLSQGGDPSSIADVLPKLEGLKLELVHKKGKQRVLVNGEDVSEFLRTPEMSMAASAVSAMPEVRDFLFDMQKNMAANNSVVMDGRDIGTVVLPEARVKIFLTASPEERARRRMLQLERKGVREDFSKVLNEVKQRDLQDSTRAVSPLKAAEDAIVIDTSNYSLKQSIEIIYKTAEEKLREGKRSC